MSLDQTLMQLLPIDLGGDHPADLAVEAKALDSAQASAQQLSVEMFPPTAYAFLERWEKLYGLSVSADDPLQARRNRVLQKMRELGGISIPYFAQLAESLGMSVIIYEHKPLMSGWMQAGDETMSVNADGTSNADWCWKVFVTDSGYLFRSGESACGEALSYSYFTELASLFNDLKPGDTFVDLINL